MAAAASRETEAIPQVPTGAIVDERYVLRRLIAQGGMGWVFEAQHRYTQRSVAIKLLLPTSLHRAAHRGRLLREAHALASVRHPNFVEVLDAGVSADLGPYVVLEMLEGRSLDGILASRQKLPVATAIQIGKRICEALSFAHSRGVVHRDIKPTNVFIARNDLGRETVKLLDLGIASTEIPALIAGATKLTQADEVLGTPEYMAPEQLFGQDVDFRCDVYATAVTLFECISGTVPYAGSYPQVLVQVASAASPPSLHKLCPWVPQALCSVIERALAKNANDRFESVEAFGRALAEVGGPSELPLTLIREGTSAGRANSVAPSAPVSGVSRAAPPAVVEVEPAAPVRTAPRERVFERAAYVTPVTIYDQAGTVIEARSEDISIKGLLVTLASELEIGARLRIRLALPMTGTVVLLTGIVRWTRPARGKTAVGLEYVEPSLDVQRAIDRFIQASRATAQV